MALLENKYNELISQARSSGVKDLQVREQGNVLYIDGTVSSEAEKDRIWSIYNKIDPDYRSADLVLNLKVSGQSEGEVYEVQKGDSLSKIGSRYGIAWREIYEANRDQIKDPDLIQPGWKLKIPKK